MEKQEEEIINDFRTVTAQLQTIWDSIGFDEVECKERTARITGVVKECLRQVLEGERKLKKTYDRRVDENGKEFHELNKALEANLPEPAESLTLIELDRYLKQHVEILHKEVKIRRNKVKERKEQEKELCECMCEEPSSIDWKSVPSKDDIMDLERRIRTLEQEKVNRQKTFRRLKGMLERLMKEVEQTNRTPFEHTVLSEIEELFTLSHANLERLKILTSDYEQKVQENEKESLELQEKIQHLYNRLEVDPTECDNFLASINGHTPSMLTKLHEEWQRLEDLKRENLALLINQQRRQLESLWEQCYISESEKNAFEPYSYEEYTEESLEAHDSEVQRLQAYYQEWKNIFLNLKRRDQLWKKFVQLEERASDPSRLKSNRGGALLLEEKERNKVRNELPRVEKELEDMVALWEKQQDRPFLVNGKRVADYIVDQWHNYYIQKEHQKEKKHSARLKQAQNDTRMGTTKNHSVSMKRRLPRNDTHRASKLRRIGEESSSGSSITSMPTRGNSTVLRERNQNTILSQVSPASKGNVSSIASDVSSYSTFMKGLHHLGEHQNVRSSAVNGKSYTPLVSCRPSPRRPPPGLPKTPKTLPRVATRRSPRLNSMQRCTPRNVTHQTPRPQQSSRNLSRHSPAPSTAAFKSPYNCTPRLRTPAKSGDRQLNL